MVNNLKFLAKWSRDLLTQYSYFKMLRTVSSLCVPNFDSVPSSMPTLKPRIHFPQVKKKTLVPGLKLLEFFWFAYNIFAVTILNIIPLTERTFQSRMLSFFEKKQFSLQFSIAYSVQSFFYFRVRLY